VDGVGPPGRAAGCCPGRLASQRAPSVRPRRAACGGDRPAALRADGPVLVGVDGLGLGAIVWCQRGAVHDRSAVADRDDGPAVPGRPGLPARRLHRLPPPGHVQPAPLGPLGLRAGHGGGFAAAGRGRPGPVGVSRAAAHPVPAAWGVQPGAAAQPQCEAGGLDHAGVRRPAGAPGHDRASGQHAVCVAAGGRGDRALRGAGASGLQPCAGHRRHRAVLGTLDRTLARHLDADAEGPRHRAHHHGQGRTVAGRRASRDHRARPVDPADLRRLGRCRGPDGGR